MTRYTFESEFLVGLHDAGGEHILREGNCPGWVVISEKIGADPGDHGGSDQNYSALTSAGHSVIVRLNHGYYGEGTLPFSRQYADFAQRCANFIEHLPDVHLWIIGNEMNMIAERPGAQIDFSHGLAMQAESSTRGIEPPPTPTPRDFRNMLSVFAPRTRGDSSIINPGETITPALYVNCYQQCRAAIHQVAGHAEDLVLIGSVAPWNENTGDWIHYFQAILTQLGPDQCDGITIHTYTHGVNPDLIGDESKMGAPYNNYHFNFRAYQDFMQVIPSNMRHLPVYITETDQNERWQDNPTEWMQRAYGEINWWNQQAGNQQIRALVLYRWQPFDQWGMQDRSGIHDAFRSAIQAGYRWNPDATPPLPPPNPSSKSSLHETGNFAVNQQVYAATFVNVRKSPGYVDKPSDDVLGQIAYGSPVTITGAALQRDELTWWPVHAPRLDGAVIDGWAAEALPDTQLLSAEEPPPQATRGQTRGLVTTYNPGDRVVIVTPDPVNIRQTPGYLDKAPGDIITLAVSGATLLVNEGPTVADDLYWWQVNGVMETDQAITGYIAEAGPGGERLITPASLRQLVTIQRPFQGDFPVTQWWGENAAFYSQFTYDFVPLKGHNGIDFGTPVNTTLVAIDAARVKKVDFEPDGFGHHIVLEHSWGESLYAHLEQVHVQIDQQVQGGEVIGLSGNSGAATTGPHLHFGLRLDPYRRTDGWGGFADPQPFMNPADLIISRSVQSTVAPMAPELPGRARP